MFKIVDENWQEDIDNWKPSQNIHVNTDDETWIKIKLTHPIGFERLWLLMNQGTLGRPKVEGSEYLGFEILQIGGSLISKQDVKQHIINALDDILG